MKKLVVVSLAALSMSGLYAADAQSNDAAPPPPGMSEARKPLPPLDDEAAPPPHKKKFDKPDKNGARKDMPPGERPRREFGRRPEGKGRPELRDKMREKAGRGDALAEALNLTPEQKKKARDIMEAAKPKLEAVREEGRQKAKAVIADAMKELRPILTPEQQAVFDDLQKLRADKAALDGAKKSDEAAKPPEKPE